MLRNCCCCCWYYLFCSCSLVLSPCLPPTWLLCSVSGFFSKSNLKIMASTEDFWDWVGERFMWSFLKKESERNFRVCFSSHVMEIKCYTGYFFLLPWWVKSVKIGAGDLFSSTFSCFPPTQLGNSELLHLAVIKLALTLLLLNLFSFCK